MTSDEKTFISSLKSYLNSDLVTLGNISDSVTLSVLQTAQMVNGYLPPNQWETVLSYLPLDYYSLLESYNLISTPSTQMSHIEKFDPKYAYNPKLYAYDKYGITNMWRPIMILNKCVSILDFNMEYIRYFDTENFTKMIAILISRKMHSTKQNNE